MTKARKSRLIMYTLSLDGAWNSKVENVSKKFTIDDRAKTQELSFGHEPTSRKQVWRGLVSMNIFVKFES
jgi:hypothetical protein